jgi:AbrB family looped-hinge helix DNA binding protein
MTTTPYTRRLDNKGRLIIPHRLRQALELNSGDELQFFYENDFIIIRNVTHNLITVGAMGSSAQEY